MINEGWVCPKCGRVLAPSTMYCLWCCSGRGTTTNTASGTPESYLAKSLRDSRDSHEIAKTENSSEIPNNCEDLQDWKDRMWAEAIVTEPQPTTDCRQTDCGDFADRLAYERGVKHAWEVAQKVFDSTVTFYEAEDVAKQIDKLQTERSE